MTNNEMNKRILEAVNEIDPKVYAAAHDKISKEIKDDLKDFMYDIKPSDKFGIELAKSLSYREQVEQEMNRNVDPSYTHIPPFMPNLGPYRNPPKSGMPKPKLKYSIIIDPDDGTIEVIEVSNLSIRTIWTNKK